MNHLNFRTVQVGETVVTRKLYVNGKDVKAHIRIDLTGTDNHRLQIAEAQQDHGLELVTEYRFETLPDLCEYLKERFDPELPW